MGSKTRKRIATRRPRQAGLNYIHPLLRPLAMPVAALVEDPNNLRTHGKKNLDAIEESLRRWGQQKPIVLDPADESIVKAGNGMLRVAHERLGWDYIAALAFSGEPGEVDAFAVADNRSGELSEWLDEGLSEFLQTLQREDEGLIVGFSGADIDQLVRKVAAVSDASLLKKLKVTIADPKTATARGEVWKVGDHTLIVADPVNEVRQWKPYLEDDVLFCPYPGPFVPVSLRGAKRIMLLVQPDPFIAGHLLDKYQEAHGKRSVKRVEA